MMVDVIVRPLAEADVREAAFWYEGKREGLGAEFTLEVGLTEITSRHVF